MKGTQSYCLLFISLVVLACKKDSASNIPLPEPEPPVDSSGYYGVFKTVIQVVLEGQSLSHDSHWNRVFFTKVPTKSESPSFISSKEIISVGGVVLNDINVNVDSYSQTYYNAMDRFPVSPNTWIVNGANGIPSFTFTNLDPIPAYTGYTSLPDTLYISHPDSIRITGITGSKQIFMSLEYGGSNHGNQILASNSTVGYFSSSVIASGYYSVKGYGSKAKINIFCQNDNYVAFKGKLFHFITMYVFWKFVTIEK